MYLQQMLLWIMVASVVTLTTAENEVRKFEQNDNETKISTEGTRWMEQLMKKHIKHINDTKLNYSQRRIRREYRMLSERERELFHKALQMLRFDTSVSPNKYEFLAGIHRQPAVMLSAHGGPNFLSWHRVFMTVIEEALREKIPSVTMPYWDSSLDYDMTDPTQSSVWSEKFFGNGHGYVVTGPFAKWSAPISANFTNTKDVILERDIGHNGTLFSKKSMSAVWSRRHTADITEPTSKEYEDFVLESYHNSVHVWVGGHMSRVPLAAYDPVFFIFHTHVDYIWEHFRTLQLASNIDPSRDYPTDFKRPQHAPLRRMDAFPWFRNVDGYSNYWTSAVYSYAPAPNCSSERPNCGSPYLICDRVHFRCKAKKSAIPAPIRKHIHFKAFHPNRKTGRKRPRTEPIKLNGLRFKGTKTDPRTQHGHHFIMF